MVRFLLDAGADQEHKTDEMHTALMEACMVSVFMLHLFSIPLNNVTSVLLGFNILHFIYSLKLC